MFAAQLQWSSLKLILTSPEREREWNEYKFDILHLARLCNELLERARKEKLEEGHSTIWRCPMFDRVLTRFSEDRLTNREEDLKEFFIEYGEIKYDKNVFEETGMMFSYFLYSQTLTNHTSDVQTGTNGS